MTIYGRARAGPSCSGISSDDDVPDAGRVVDLSTRPLNVGESKAPALELFLEDPVLLDQVGDDPGLITLNPAGKRAQQQLEAEEVERHAPIVGQT